MLKIKNLRTADCVVGGFRYGTKTKQVASLLLGLYDKAGLLNHVGFTSGLANIDKDGLTKKLEGLEQARLHRRRARRPEPLEQGGPQRRLASLETQCSSSKCNTTISAATASATAPACFAGGRKRSRIRAASIR